MRNYRYNDLKDVKTKNSLTAVDKTEKLVKSQDILLWTRFVKICLKLVLNFRSRFVEKEVQFALNVSQAYLVVRK